MSTEIEWQWIEVQTYGEGSFGLKGDSRDSISCMINIASLSTLLTFLHLFPFVPGFADAFRPEVRMYFKFRIGRPICVAYFLFLDICERDVPF